MEEQRINEIIDRVVDQLLVSVKGEKKSISSAQSPVTPLVQPESKSPPFNARGCFAQSEEAIAAAHRAFQDYQAVSIAERKKIISAIRELCLENLEALSQIAVSETGLGRFQDKLVKNEVAILKTPGVEDLEPKAYTGDGGLTVEERAPFGVIGAITPCTNPSETIICNTIGMIAGGNAVSFNPHPSAKKTSVFTVDLINQAIISAGGPPNLITTVFTPTIQSAQVLMKHPLIKLLVVTGGPAVVAAAMNSGKKVIAAGPGNPPVVVDETADIDKAAKEIVQSASTDNNIICVVEKNIIVTKKAADALKQALIHHGAVELNSLQTKRLEAVIVENGQTNKKWVGKDVQVILKQIGLDIDAAKRLAIAETTAAHPFAKLELLMPVVPFIRVADIDEAIAVAYELEDHCFHTASIYSKNIEHMHKMAVKMNTTIFVKNGPTLAGLGLGGEGPASFTIASPTGEGITTARHFTRTRRCTVAGYFRIT